MFSGYLMTATHNLDGVHGYRGWQWLFIVCGIISIPIAVASFFLLPDIPEITRAVRLIPLKTYLGCISKHLLTVASVLPY
jgi:ACS family pantothenate transporter-like MFS transporter